MNSCALALRQAFLLLTLLSMMNCAVHQILKISVKIYLLVSLSGIYFTVATLEVLHFGRMYGKRYVCGVYNSVFSNKQSFCNEWTEWG